jgi:hypothetical protein
MWFFDRADRISFTRLDRRDHTLDFAEPGYSFRFVTDHRTQACREGRHHMPKHPWHPFGPDQEFGHQASVDQEFLDEVLDRLEHLPTKTPRAGNKAALAGPSGAAGGIHPRPPMHQASWFLGAGSDEPVTTASALDAAVRLRESPID